MTFWNSRFVVNAVYAFKDFVSRCAVRIPPPQPPPSHWTYQWISSTNHTNNSQDTKQGHPSGKWPSLWVFCKTKAIMAREEINYDAPTNTASGLLQACQTHDDRQCQDHCKLMRSAKFVWTRWDLQHCCAITIILIATNVDWNWRTVEHGLLTRGTWLWRNWLRKSYFLLQI